MTLANDIYTLLNAGWVTATIAKPTRFIVNQVEDKAIQMRDLIIMSEEEGTFEENCADGSDDIRNQSFQIFGAEGSESDCGKCIAIIKGILKRNSSVSNGTYTIKTYKIKRDLQVCKYYLTGQIHKLIEYNAF